jgi:DNA-binding phage protein
MNPYLFDAGRMMDMTRKRPEFSEPTERVPEGMSIIDYVTSEFNTRDPERIARSLWIAALSMGWHEFTARVGTPRMFLTSAFRKGADIPFETVSRIMQRLGVVLTSHVNLPQLNPGTKPGFAVTWSETEQRYLATCDRVPDLQHADIDPVTALNGLLLQIRKRHSV